MCTLPPGLIVQHAGGKAVFSEGVAKLIAAKYRDHIPTGKQFTYS
jgi:hypothetical protein